MNSKWTIKKLNEIINFNPKETIPKGSIAKKVSMDKLQPFCKNISGYELTKFTSGTKFRNGDTIMARITPCLENGKIAKVNILDNNEVGFGSTEYIVFRAKEGVDPDYIYYLVCSPNVRETAIKSMVGSSGRQRVQTDVVQNIEIIMPPYEEQIKISSILCSLDDKIELNNKINKNLEQQAQAIFKSWFIDFEPFGGTKPNNWKNGRLRDILKLKRNSIKVGDNTILPYLPIDIIPMHTFAPTDFKSNKEAKSSLIVFSKDDIIIGAMRIYFHRVIIAPCDGITRTTCFVLSPYDKDYLSFSLLYCNQNSSIEYAQNTSKGSTMPYAIWDGGFGNMEIVIPSKSQVKKFNEIVLPMIRKIQNTYFYNKNLYNLRNILLPKLMSGEIDVSDIDI